MTPVPVPLFEIEHGELERQQASFRIYSSVHQEKVQRQWTLPEAMYIESLLNRIALSYDQGVYSQEDFGGSLEDDWLIWDHCFQYSFLYQNNKTRLKTNIIGYQSWK